MAERPAASALASMALLAVSTFLVPPAEARSRHHHARAPRAHAMAMAEPTDRVIQCVAFARADSGVQLPGNAANWWDNAAGIYARGTAPETGSILNFRANARMRLGHVAVVSAVLNAREVLIDQSHWNGNGVSRDISVVDVSPDNDWTAVRVAVNRAGSYGSIYPTFGFIYPRPDNGVVVATATPRRFEGHRHEVTLEVAEAPDRAFDLSAGAATITDDAPDRAFR